MTEGAATSRPIEGVIFDFHGTLFDSHDPSQWIGSARRHLGSHGRRLQPHDTNLADLARHLNEIWAHARRIDPVGERDLDHDRHREIFCQAAMLRPDVDREFADALYAEMVEAWVPYQDTLPVLRALQAGGIRTALLSNIGRDIRPRLHRTGVADFLDDVVLSYEVGMVKPDPGIFQLALDRLAVPADRALMVGDTWRDDAGGASLGVRTLILPRTSGPVHGLAAVLRLALTN